LDAAPISTSTGSRRETDMRELSIILAATALISAGVAGWIGSTLATDASATKHYPIKDSRPGGSVHTLPLAF
jgi:hypothetical protein